MIALTVFRGGSVAGSCRRARAADPERGRLGPDTPLEVFVADVPDAFRDLVADTRVEFYLATTDPAGGRPGRGGQAGAGLLQVGASSNKTYGPETEVCAYGAFGKSFHHYSAQGFTAGDNAVGKKPAANSNTQGKYLCSQ